jgi:transposase
VKKNSKLINEISMSALLAADGKPREMVIGLDLGDRTSYWFCLDKQSGAKLGAGSIATRAKEIREYFSALPKSVVAMETGTHSPWMNDILQECGHTVVTANARNVKLITQSKRKNDKVDAETLARLARVDVKLLSPIIHRSRQRRAELAVIKAREAAVEARTALVNTVRGMVKSAGERVAKCATESFTGYAAEAIPAELMPALGPLLQAIDQLNETIYRYDCDVEQMAQTNYAVDYARLEQVDGVGPVTAMAFLLTLEDSARFAKSRDVGSYLGLTPRQHDSGESCPQLRISKAGDSYLRKLLVNCAHHILGWRGRDSALRRWGLKLAERGGKNGKKRAVVAVARKLAVLLHRLWVSGERYEPLRGCAPAVPAAA